MSKLPFSVKHSRLLKAKKNVLIHLIIMENPGDSLHGREKWFSLVITICN